MRKALPAAMQQQYRVMTTEKRYSCDISTAAVICFAFSVGFFNRYQIMKGR